MYHIDAVTLDKLIITEVDNNNDKTDDEVKNDNLVPAAYSGDYRDLINAPNIRNIIKGDPDLAKVAFSGNYNDLMKLIYPKGCTFSCKCFINLMKTNQSILELSIKRGWK